jgi:hypothetical protein
VKIKLAYLARREPEQARQAAFRWCIRDAAGRFPHHQASHAGSVPRGARKREYSTVGQGGLCRFSVQNRAVLCLRQIITRLPGRH